MIYYQVPISKWLRAERHFYIYGLGKVEWTGQTALCLVLWVLLTLGSKEISYFRIGVFLRR